MTDLISRQDAIDAIRASTLKYTGFMGLEMYTDDDAVEALSPAQPEQRWIPCSERLPEEVACYLVTVKNWSIPTQIDSFISKREWDDREWDAFGDRVIAWQPLPEPYKEEEE